VTPILAASAVEIRLKRADTFKRNRILLFKQLFWRLMSIASLASLSGQTFAAE
jgi:hypothetical protein